MTTGTWLRPQKGLTLIETSITLGIVGVLSLAGLGSLSFGPSQLLCVQHELQGALDHAFAVSRAQGQNVTVALGHAKGSSANQVPVPIPRAVCWGKPASVPLPPGMDKPVDADATGEAHARITVTPRRTVTAATWFFHQGKDVLCLRLSGHGRLTTLRWRPADARWARVN